MTGQPGNLYTVAVFLVPGWGMKPIMALGFLTDLPSYIGWQASTTTRCHSQLHPPVTDKELGLSTLYLIGSGCEYQTREKKKGATWKSTGSCL
jgi:hypothetical protein